MEKSKEAESGYENLGLSPEQQGQCKILEAYLRRLNEDWDIKTSKDGEMFKVFYKEKQFGYFDGHKGVSYFDFSEQESRVFTSANARPFFSLSRLNEELFNAIKGNGIGIALYIKFFLSIKKMHLQITEVQSSKNIPALLKPEAENIYKRLCEKGLFTYDLNDKRYKGSFLKWCTPEVIEAIEKQVQEKGCLPEYKDKITNAIRDFVETTKGKTKACVD